MLNETTLNIYKSLNLEKPVIPIRSRLYSQEPIGVGTSYSESLTSYTTRLAEAHCVPTGLLIYTEIASYYQEEFLLDGKKKYISHLIGSSEHHRALNGIGLIANRLIQALEKLTLRTELRFLTMETWKEVISTRGLFRFSKAWCPICYEEWRVAGKLIYEPLIWGLEVVTVCLIHHQHLQTLCPYCENKLFSLAWYSRPGCCSICQKWLGISSKVSSNLMILSNEELCWQQSVINNINQLISKAPSLSFLIRRERIEYFILACINKFFNGNLKEFASAIETSKSTVDKWCNNKANPKIISVLKICNFFKISLFDFFTKEFNRVDFSLFIKHQDDKPKKIKSHHATKTISIDVVNMQRLIDLALNEYPPPTLEDLKQRLGIKSIKSFHQYFPNFSHEILARYKKYKIDDLQEKLSILLLSHSKSNNPPLSLGAIASKMKVSYKTLKKYFPDLCDEITKKYIIYEHQYKVEVFKHTRHHIREIVTELHTKGIKPNSTNVIKILGNRKVILNKKSQSILKEIWIELGYLELL